MDEPQDSFQELLLKIDASHTVKRSLSDVRPDPLKGKLPTFLDTITDDWKPLPKVEEVRHLIGGTGKRFNNKTRHHGAGLQFRDEGFLHHKKEMDLWTIERCLMPPRSYSYTKIPPNRYHAQPEPFGFPDDKMCGVQHRNWLPGHYEQRKKYVYPVHTALLEVDKAKAAHEHHKLQKEQTTKLLTSNQQNKVNLDAHARASLSNVKKKIMVATKLQKIGGHDQNQEDEDKAYNRFLKAESNPHIRFRESTPPGAVKHLRHWKGPDALGQHTIDGSFRLSTPWLHNKEVQELKDKGHKTR